MKIKILLIITSLFFTIYLYSQNSSTPKKGEGIDGFLRRNGCTISSRTEFENINKGKFGKDGTLLLGVSYRLPSKNNSSKNVYVNNQTSQKPGSIHEEPLFGKMYEKYNIESNQLKGACFFLVSGHGGPDCGAIAKIRGKELHEDEYAYDVMLRLARNLLQHGATVHIIIQDGKDGIRDVEFLSNNKSETCMGKQIPLDQKARLKQRTDKINELSKKSKEKYQRTIFIHLDSRGQKEQLDVYFYHQANQRSKKLAENMRSTFRKQYQMHQPGRGFSGTVSHRSLYVLNNTQPTAIFAELANMQNKSDHDRFLKVNNRKALANWMLKAFIKDFEDSKK